jgi:uncharacterized membrane protein
MCEKPPTGSRRQNPLIAQRERIRAVLAIIAAVLFAVALIIHATGTATAAIFSVTSLALAALACLALYLAGFGSGWSRSRRR